MEKVEATNVDGLEIIDIKDEKISLPFDYNGWLLSSDCTNVMQVNHDGLVLAQGVTSLAIKEDK